MYRVKNAKGNIKNNNTPDSLAGCINGIKIEIKRVNKTENFAV